MENKNEKSMTLEEMIGEMLKDAKVVKVPLPVKAEEEKKAQKQDKPMPARPLGAPLLSINIENLHVLKEFDIFLQTASYLEVLPCRWGYVRLFNEGDPINFYAVLCRTPQELYDTLENDLAIEKEVQNPQRD